ncbi:MAG: hypothetical protein MUF87_13495 [Anaerolineae bacterium]|jgi:hypothetical protein|nr:hypothetical protein [Anaerolineae bacterium]
MPDFTIVGVFLSAETAHKHAAELRKWCHELIDWYTPRRSHGFTLDQAPSSIEQQIAKIYRIKWDTAVDWIARDLRHEDVDHAVQVIDHLLILQNIGKTRTSGEPFDAWIKKIAPKMLRQIPNDPMITVKFQFQHPDPKDTIRLLRPYFRQQGIASPPWIAYADGALDKDLDHHYQTARRVKEQETALYHDFQKTIERLTRSRGVIALGDDLAQAAQADFEQKRAALPTLDPTILANLMHWEQIVGASQGKVRQRERDQMIFLERVVFFRVDRGLIALLAWLGAIGATEIGYTLDQLRSRD